MPPSGCPWLVRLYGLSNDERQAFGNNGRG
jgi:hypothetical protein